MATPTERLAWPDEAPPAGATAPAARRPAGAMWPWYLLLLLLVGAVAAGGWWLSQGREAAPPQLPAEQSIPIPVTPAPAEIAAADSASAADAVAAAANSAAPALAAPDRPSAAPARPTERATSPADGRRAEASAPADATRPRAASRAALPADDPAAEPPATGTDAVLAYSPRPYGGRVVQLGAFPTRTQAEESWRRITRRYPYLTTKPKMVNTVDVRGLGNGRPTRMYRLQLGTSSQAQSVVICQQLERAGHSCVVVY